MTSSVSFSVSLPYEYVDGLSIEKGIIVVSGGHYTTYNATILALQSHHKLYDADLIMLNAHSNYSYGDNLYTKINDNLVIVTMFNETIDLFGLKSISYDGLKKSLLSISNFKTLLPKQPIYIPVKFGLKSLDDNDWFICLSYISLFLSKHSIIIDYDNI